MPRTTVLYDVRAQIRHETEKAYLLQNDFSKKVWVPKSSVEDNGDGTFTMPEWLIMEKEIEHWIVK
jgi:hypothetical protein